MLSKPGKDFKLIVLILCALLAFASCEKDGPECYEPILVRPSCAFVAVDTLTVPTTDTTKPKADSLIRIYPDSIMPKAELKVLDEAKSYAVFGTEQGSSIMRIAFNPAKDSIRYTFRTDSTSTLRDTLTFFYTPVVHFISNSCGYNYYYTLNKVKATGQLIDSISLINNSVTNDIKVRNVSLYFKPDF